MENDVVSNQKNGTSETPNIIQLSMREAEVEEPQPVPPQVQEENIIYIEKRTIEENTVSLFCIIILL